IREHEGNPELLRNLPEGGDGIARPGRLFRVVGNGGSQLGLRQILVPREPEQRLPATRCIHVVNAASPRNCRSFVRTERKVSWTASAASSGSPSTRRQRL